MKELRLTQWRKFQGRPGPLLIVIMDGIGIGRQDESNAVYLARTPTLDRLLDTCPHTQLLAHGPSVGLPSWDDMGNSEVGHNAIGAGRVFDQGAKLVNQEIASGGIFETPLWGGSCRSLPEGPNPPFHRSPLRRQRPQPHRPTVCHGPEGRRDGRDPASGPSPAGRPRRGRNIRSGIRRTPGGGAGQSEPGKRL